MAITDIWRRDYLITMNGEKRDRKDIMHAR